MDIEGLRQIEAIRELGRGMTPAKIAAAHAAVRAADEYQADEYAARGARTSPSAALSIWCEPGISYYAALVAEGHDPFTAGV